MKRWTRILLWFLPLIGMYYFSEIYVAISIITISLSGLLGFINKSERTLPTDNKIKKFIRECACSDVKTAIILLIEGTIIALAGYFMTSQN